jgi:hypothetical protein
MARRYAISTAAKVTVQVRIEPASAWLMVE